MFGSLKTSRVVLLAAVALIALQSAGCGRRGDLEPPNASATHAANDAHNFQLHRTTQKITPPKKDFALDPLLQ